MITLCIALILLMVGLGTVIFTIYVAGLALLSPFIALYYFVKWLINLIF